MDDDEFGPAWERAMMKMTKKQMVVWIKWQLIMKNAMKAELRRLKVGG